MQSKNLIGAADLEWIFACNSADCALCFMNIKTVTGHRLPLSSRLYDR